MMNREQAADILRQLKSEYAPEGRGHALPQDNRDPYDRAYLLGACSTYDDPLVDDALMALLPQTARDLLDAWKQGRTDRDACESKMAHVDRLLADVAALKEMAQRAAGDEKRVALLRAHAERMRREAGQ